MSPRPGVLMRLIGGLPKLEVNYLYAHDLRPAAQAPPCVPCTVRKLTAGELDLIQEIRAVPPERLLSKLQRGDTCYASFIGGRIASYHWVQVSGRHRVQRAGRYLELGSGEFVIYYVRVAEWAKGQGVNPYVQSVILDEHRRSGFRKGWIYTTLGNTASRKGIERSGWVLEQVLLALSLREKYFMPLPGLPLRLWRRATPSSWSHA